MIARDQDAAYYVSHPKFPTQIARLSRFLKAHPARGSANKALDLGCGPGPATRLLMDARYDTVAVDFSIRSLALNAAACSGDAAHVMFVQADLNAVAFANDAFDGLMMADFLQHLGDKHTQKAFLAKAFRALKPGGWFYLSFFNTNLYDRLRRDYAGVRRDIPYWRVPPDAVRAMLPAGAIVENMHYMNVFDRAKTDRFAARLPMAALAARMVVIEGRKKS